MAMSYSPSKVTEDFEQLVNEIPHIGFKRHALGLIKNAETNFPYIKKTIKNLTPPHGVKSRSAIVISAGPSVHKRQSIERILESGYQGTVISADGVYIACLKAGLIPDYVMTLDPHPTRIVRWFGDPDFEKNSFDDDYFARQDLDIEFRKNSLEKNKLNIELVNKFGSKTKAIVASCAPFNVVKRLLEAKFDMYWWNPLVDDPEGPSSLSKRLYQFNKLPCMNTGGTVGTAAWVFAASRLNIPHVAVVGMDYGYYATTPFKKTQTYYELIDRLGTEEGIERFFTEATFPLTGEKFYTDPTYFWYRKNFLELVRLSPKTSTYNCTEGGTLIDESISCISLDTFLENSKVL